jgi:hypothetical protein
VCLLDIPPGAGAIFVEQFGYRLTQLAGNQDDLKEWRAMAL